MIYLVNNLINVFHFSVSKTAILSHTSLHGQKVLAIEETGEQCAVVFALIFTEPASDYVCVEVVGVAAPFRNNLCKDDSALFSRFLHGTLSNYSMWYHFANV